MNGSAGDQKKDRRPGICCGGVSRGTAAVHMDGTNLGAGGQASKGVPPVNQPSALSGHSATRGPGASGLPQPGPRPGQPPCSNTGGKVTNPVLGAAAAAAAGVRLDVSVSRDVVELEKSCGWFAGSFPEGLRDKIAAVLVSYFGGPFTSRDRGANSYGQSSVNEAGALLAWSDGRPDAWVCLNASVLGLLLPEQVPELLVELVDLGVRPTRIDLTVDIPTTWVEMEHVHEAARAGQVHGFRKYDPRRPIKNMATGELAGDTAYFGSRGGDGSGKFVRFYSKGLESGGRLNATRFEVEASGDIARGWVEVLLSRVDRFWEKAGSLAVGAIDFVDRSGAHRHRDRFTRLTWWDRVVSLARAARVHLERQPSSLQRSAEWVQDQLAVLFARIGLTIEQQQGLPALDALRDFVTVTFKRGLRSDRAVPSSLPLDVGTILGIRTTGTFSP